MGVVEPGEASGAEIRVVLDTNRVLDAWLFDDPSVAMLKRAVEEGTLTWLVTASMRDELQRVLTYPAIVRQLERRACAAAGVLRSFDRWAHVVPPAEDVSMRCADPDDQVFINLAVAWRADLYSRDEAVRALAPRLRSCGVRLPGPWVADKERSEPAVRKT